MASGEMSVEGFCSFLKASLRNAAEFSRDVAVHYVCIDWRHVKELIKAAGPIYGAMINLAVWVKSNAGQGSFYRSQHELIGAFRVGTASHKNNIELGRHGRNRSNVWHYAGVNTFRTGRMDDLSAHPTVKPVALVADAMKDCTRRGDVVLDTFCGSGTTILAAERIGRQARAMEIDPCYVDVAIRRWQAFTGKDAVHGSSGQTFDELAENVSSTDQRASRAWPAVISGRRVWLRSPLRSALSVLVRLVNPTTTRSATAALLSTGSFRRGSQAIQRGVPAATETSAWCSKRS